MSMDFKPILSVSVSVDVSVNVNALYTGLYSSMALTIKSERQFTYRLREAKK